MLEELNKRTLKLKLTRKTLGNLKKIMELKGEGTKDSPFIIDDLGDVFAEFTIKTKGTYLVLRNLTISKVKMLNSRNVAIENCFVGRLNIVRCRNLTFRNNSIMTAKQFLSRNCFFENNIIVYEQYKRKKK